MSANRLLANRLSANRLSANCLSANRLSVNHLSVNCPRAVLIAFSYFCFVCNCFLSVKMSYCGELR
jgi:hypothetical protein